jgi:hypothetical protein
MPANTPTGKRLLLASVVLDLAAAIGMAKAAVIASDQSASLMLLGSALVGLGFVGRRRKAV